MSKLAEQLWISPQKVQGENLSSIDTCRLAQLHLAKVDRDVMSLEADLGDCGGDEFKSTFPDRFLDFGIAEANMVGAASGLSMKGKKPFINTFSTFGLMRACEQLRIDICYHKANVKLAGMFSGIASGASGPTHHSIEDISIARSLPNMVVLAPSDALSTYQATIAAANYDGPVFIRLGVDKTPNVYDEMMDFEIGKGNVLTEGKDLTIIAAGLSSVSNSLKAANILKHSGYYATVIDMHTIKPIDRDLIVKYAKKTNNIVTVEEHSMIGGLGSSVAEVLAEECPTNQKIIGLPDEYCKNIGPYDAHLKSYGLDPGGIANSCYQFLTGRDKND